MARWGRFAAVYAGMALFATILGFALRGAPPFTMPAWLPLKPPRDVLYSLGLGACFGLLIAVGTRFAVPRFAWAKNLHRELRPLTHGLSSAGIVGLAATGSGEWGVGSGGAAVGRQRPTPQSRPPHSPLQDLARHKDGDEPMTKLDKDLTTELEAAAFRRLVEHFRNRTDVQNIDLMNLAGFCRNCLSNWYQEAAAERGVTLTKDAAREIVYGMPYKEWQAQHQKEATPEQKAAFAAGKPHGH